MFTRPVKLGGRGITRKEKKGEHYGVSPFSGDDVDYCAGFVSAQEVRASESSEQDRE